MERPDSLGSTIYAVGSTADDIIVGLGSPAPLERAKSAQTIGELHIYSGLPDLLETARDDSDESVRDAARWAVVALMPTEENATRAIAGEPPSQDIKVATPQHFQVGNVVWAFGGYVLGRTTPPYQPNQDDVRRQVRAYFDEWGWCGTRDLDELGLAGARAVGKIATFLDIPNQSASAKAMAFRDAVASAEEFKSLKTSLDSLPA